MRNATLRWVVKKTARRIVAGTAILRQVGRLHDGTTPRVRVLTYHDFGDMMHDPFCVHPEVLEEHMAMLAREGLAVSLTDLEAFVCGKRPLKDGSVLVTVDDGCPSLFTRALPIFRHHRIPAVAFVPVGELTTSGDTRGRQRDDRMCWNEIDALVEAGVSIASHGWTHTSLARLSPEAAREEAVRSREVLERHLGRPMTAFAYPFGTRADFNDGTAAILRDAGYSCAFTSQHGAVLPGMDSFSLPRIKVEGGEGRWMFRAAITGGMDWWRVVDRTLWSLQASPT